jgi:hypothetical protein
MPEAPMSDTDDLEYPAFDRFKAHTSAPECCLQRAQATVHRSRAIYTENQYRFRRTNSVICASNIGPQPSFRAQKRTQSWSGITSNFAKATDAREADAPTARPRADARDGNHRTRGSLSNKAPIPAAAGSLNRLRARRNANVQARARGDRDGYRDEVLGDDDSNQRSRDGRGHSCPDCEHAHRELRTNAGAEGRHRGDGDGKRRYPWGCGRRKGRSPPGRAVWRRPASNIWPVCDFCSPPYNTSSQQHWIALIRELPESGIERLSPADGAGECRFVFC